MSELQDLVVIGGGAGGFAAAMRAAQMGARVSVVESTLYGGNCMNKACIPLTFLASRAQLIQRARRLERSGIRFGPPQVDMNALQDHKDLLIEGLRMGTEQLLSDYGITLIEGRGRLAGPDTVDIEPPAGSGRDRQQIRARNVVIATGSTPAQLPIEGADLPGVIGTEEAVELREIPKRIAVIGSQPWDVELAQYFRLMGSEVTLISSGEQLVVGIDRDMSQRLSKLLHDEGMTILRRSSAEGIRANGDGTLSVVLSGPGTTGKDVTVDRVLAARRLSNSGGLGLRELGVKMDGASILVNDRMETNLPHLYAIGDVTAGPMWSHKANAEGIIAAENALGQPSRMSYGTIPYCVNTIPQVAWVGLTEEQAEAQQIGIAIGKIPTAFNPMAMILDETAGEIKVIASARHGKILGAHIMAPGAADLINAVAMAMAAEATVGELMQMVPRHPSLGEALVDAAMDVEKRSLHMPKW